MGDRVQVNFPLKPPYKPGLDKLVGHLKKSGIKRGWLRRPISKDGTSCEVEFEDGDEAMLVKGGWMP